MKRKTLIKHTKRPNGGSFLFTIPVELFYNKAIDKRKANIMAELLLRELCSYPTSNELTKVIKNAEQRALDTGILDLINKRIN